MNILKSNYGPVDVLHEDSSIIVLSKPHGLHVIDDRNRTEETLKALLIEEFGGIFVVHRLDAGTGGVIIFAKNARSHSFLCSQFENGGVDKEYQAIVSGVMSAQVTLELPISSKPNHGRYKVNFKSGKNAITSFYPLKTFKDATLVKAVPFTGRTHQIRVHLRVLKHPLYQDWLYNKETEDRRLTLFAKKLSIVHPETRSNMTFEAPLSMFMEEWLEKM